MGMDASERRYSRGWLIFVITLVVLILLAVGLYVAINRMIRQTTEQAVSPIQDANNRVATQMSVLLNPTPTILPDPMTIVHDVRSLARLETIQYTMEKVVTAESGQGELAFLFGDRLLFVAHGKVIAGVDLSKMRPEDLWVESGILYARLPQAEIFVATLDNEKSYVYDRNTGILNKGQVDLETNARQVAEREILKAAMEEGILTQAQANAESYLERMFMSIGYDDVVFVQGSSPLVETPAPETPVAPTITPFPMVTATP